MVEQWLEQGKRRGQKLGQRLIVVRPRTWSVVILAVAVALAAWHPLAVRLRPKPNLDAIADEVGSISYLFNGRPFSVRKATGLEGDPPHINHAGTKVLSCRTSENGGAIFITDLLTGQKTTVYEEMAADFESGPRTDLEAHFWSPDDTKLVYSRPVQNIVVYDAVAGKELAALHVSYTSDMAWLDNASLVCVNSHAGELQIIRQQADGAWKPDGQPIAASRKGDPFQSFAALSPDTVAWIETNRIVTFNLTNRQTQVLAGAEGEALKDFAYQPKTGQFLLTSAAGKTDSLWRLDWAGQTNQELVRVASAPVIRGAHWIAGGQGFAYVNDRNFLIVQTNAAAGPEAWFTHGRADSFSVSADGQRLAVTAIASNEPALGLWEYDVAAGQPRLVMPAAGRGLAHVVPATHPPLANHSAITIPGPPHRRLRLVIYKPMPFDPHKKYPLVLANTPYLPAEPYMDQYGMAIASAGGYFVVLDRRGWFAKDGYADAWSENEPYAIRYLARDPTVDRRRIFLVSNCIESNFLKDYAAKYPGTVAGGIMLIANSLPNPDDFASGAVTPRLLNSTCDAWEGKGDRMKKYQETCARAGVEYDYVIHPNTKHDFVSEQSQRARIRAMLHFVFDE